MSATKPDGTTIPEPTAALAPQSEEMASPTAPSTEQPKADSSHKILEIQAAAMQLMESIAPSFYRNREKLLGDIKATEKIEPEVTQMFFSDEDIVQLFRACQGVTWKIRDDPDGSLRKLWSLRGKSTPDASHRAPCICIAAPGADKDSKDRMLSFTVA